MDPLRDASHNLKRQIRKTVRQATEAAGGASRINVSSARNIVVSATNEGADATGVVSARQSVHVRQRDGETIEDTVSESTVTTNSDGVEARSGTVRTRRTVRTSTGGVSNDE